jgi:hypothetical protein
MIEIEVKSIEELIQFFRNDKVTAKMIKYISSMSLNVFINDLAEDQPSTKEECIEKLKSWWAEWQHTCERPLFI